jgi:hypothetical protein
LNLDSYIFKIGPGWFGPVGNRSSAAGKVNTGG